MAVLRELLPCPAGPDAVLVGAAGLGSLSRSTARRVRRRSHEDVWVKECLTSLNELYAHGGSQDGQIGSTALPPNFNEFSMSGALRINCLVLVVARRRT